MSRRITVWIGDRPSVGDENHEGGGWDFTLPLNEKVVGVFGAVLDGRKRVAIVTEDAREWVTT